MAQKVGSREKLAQKEGRREIYSPVPSPLLKPPASSRQFQANITVNSGLVRTPLLRTLGLLRTLATTDKIQIPAKGLTESGSDY